MGEGGEGCPSGGRRRGGGGGAGPDGARRKPLPRAEAGGGGRTPRGRAGDRPGEGSRLGGRLGRRPAGAEKARRRGRFANLREGEARGLEAAMAGARKETA